MYILVHCWRSGGYTYEKIHNERNAVLYLALLPTAGCEWNGRKRASRGFKGRRAFTFSWTRQEGVRGEKSMFLFVVACKLFKNACSVLLLQSDAGRFASPGFAKNMF